MTIELIRLLTGEQVTIESIDDYPPYAQAGYVAKPLTTFNFGLSLVDLGIVNAVDLLNGPQTLFTPAGSQFVSFVVSDADFVAIDNGFGVHFSLGDADLLDWGQFGSTTPTSMIPMNGLITSRAITCIGEAADHTSWTITAPLAAWQASHSYPANAVILGADDHLWTSSGGTSDTTIPDFAGNEGGTVVDNDITWTDAGAVPTQGSLHVYALVGTTS